MTLTVVEYLSVAGIASTPNEDIANHSTSAAWALDGATGLSKERLLPGPSDAAWLTARYSALLREHADRVDLAPRRLFGDLIAEVARSFEAERLRAPGPRYELPSAGIAFVRLAHGQLEYARLGDCRAILALPDGRVVSTRCSELHHRLDRGVIRRMEELRRTGAARSYAEARQAVQDELRANRSLLNTVGGYWVLGTDPEAARQMEIGAIPVGAGARISGLLVTDGFYRLVDTFGAFRDDTALLAEAREHGLEALLYRLRALEDADPDCIVHPRLKPKDDATALLFNAIGTSAGAWAAPDHVVERKHVR